MSVRRAVAEADLSTLNVAAFCREHGIRRDAFYRWRRRFETEGEAGLESRSRAPKRVANRTPHDIEDRIVEIRKRLLDDGLDAGPETIHVWLSQDSSGWVPSPSTIWRVLDRRGFIEKDPAKAPGRHWRSFAAERANECWQMDSTHYELADGTDVEIINVLDDCSRLVVAAHATARCTLATTWEALTAAAARYGWPERMLTDNGSMFGSTLETNLAALGIALRHSRPYHPQTCGKVERFHRTLKQRLAAFDTPKTLTGLQAAVDTFIDYYNHQRPHRGIGRRRPHDVWSTTPRSGPDSQPITQPTDVYRATVYDGIVWAARRYRIRVGSQHNDADATIVITGMNAHVFADGRLIRALTIDPTRTHQPFKTRPNQ